MEKSDNFIWEKNGATGILSIHNPPGNSLREPDFIEPELLVKLTDDISLKGIIIKGTGRHFSSGGDMQRLKQLAQEADLLEEKIKKGKKLADFIETLQIPVIASISGICFGGGLEIALACHIRICSENALFAFPETNYNIIPGLGGTIRLSNIVGVGKATEFILSGDIIDAEKALVLKLVDYIAPVKELQKFTENFMDKLTADREPDVIRSVMTSINNSKLLGYEKALEEETKLFCRIAVKNLPKTLE